MHILFKTLLVFHFLTAAISSKAQTNNDDVDSLAGRFIMELHNNTKEQIFVQTNKWFYTAGEELWLKAYIINAISHKLYSHSKTLYADLVDDKDSAVAQLLLNIPRQQTEGLIPLSIDLREGYYWLRVYTANMLQHDSLAISVLPIYVVNKRLPSILTDEVNDTVKVTTNETLQVSFFPEGGALIEATNAIIGFKITDTKGRPTEVSGYITDSLYKEVTVFKSDSNGLGRFNYFVLQSRKSIAHIKWNNQEFTWQLPKSTHYASRVSVIEEDANNIKALVSLDDSLYKKDRRTYLLGISRDSLCFASVGEGMYEVSIPKRNFPSGIATLVLFNDQKQVVSERAVYINKEKEGVVIKTNKDNYKIRDKVTLTITNGDGSPQSEIAALSISVNDDNLAEQPLESATNPYQQLEITNQPSDDFLLTQPQLYTGKNFNTYFAAVTPKESFDVDSSITDIKGKIVNNKNQPLANRIITLYSTQKINLFTSTITDSSGHFTFPMLYYPDSIMFTIQVSDKKGFKENDKIVIEPIPYPKFATPLSLKQRLSLPQIHQLQNFREKHLDDYTVGTGKEWLKGVTVFSKRKILPYDENKRISMFSRILTGDELRKLTNNDIGIALLMVPGFHYRPIVVGLNGPTSMVGVESSFSKNFRIDASGGPLWILDGAYVTEEVAMATPPNIIDFIEVLNPPQSAFFGTRGANGAVIINTKINLNIESGYDKVGILRYIPKSYHMAPEFSMPDYNDKRVKESNFNDSRSTLYWNGHVYTNDKGKAVVSFFTADAVSTYTITVSGITVNGDIIYKKSTFNTK